MAKRKIELGIRRVGRCVGERGPPIVAGGCSSCLLLAMPCGCLLNDQGGYSARGHHGAQVSQPPASFRPRGSQALAVCPPLELQQELSYFSMTSFNEEGFHFPAPAPTPAPTFSPPIFISPLTIFQAISALRPRLSLDCSKLLPFSFSSRLILTTAAVIPTETAKIGSRVLR